MAKILIIEDEPSLVMPLEYDLKDRGYEVDVAEDGETGLDKLKNGNYDLAIIDWMLPGMSGIDIITNIRETNNKIKIILLTAKSDEMSVVKGLDAGANDYVTKPYSPRELGARIKSQLRDSETTEVAQTDAMVQVTPRIAIDYPKRDVYLDGEIIELTKIQYDLFVYLVENKNKVVSREQIMQKVWGYNYEPLDRSIDVYIHEVRKKLDLKVKEKIIENKRGVGYIFNSPDSVNTDIVELND